MPEDNILNQSKRFLNELHSNEVEDFHYVLENLLEELENKPDPELYEIHLVENISQYLEKLKIMEANLSIYVDDTYKELPGNKIFKLIKYTDEKYLNEI